MNSDRNIRNYYRAGRMDAFYGSNKSIPKPILTVSGGYRQPEGAAAWLLPQALWSSSEGVWNLPQGRYAALLRDLGQPAVLNEIGFPIKGFRRFPGAV